ncbi:bifunctional folylpolyglutamate synthase/dihydrofolate synthase [Nitratidesulfovibrio sp. SRB-5]|uniref:bifunctional folylpolyglutamate synthase/dihydrofolate synthase n=1 Tax=Nitratidesulfovibrio sp. SRB-5 TaxID=2872636 RepID=UPI001CBB0370|nr:bifunctional folylpolyglutamate synthase/dihydrofolate synthase [Nitratidesulfovibrio sp. SRB-5]MBZ2172534.1 bifunctional folylpolyglutamate synthase/dihydrofolate synthase [Nitratidesulfovibrio sp. SRB-5]
MTHVSAASPFATYDDVQSHLDRLGMFHMDLGLGRMERVLDALSLAAPPFTVAQVVGTNGKGSTSTFLAAIGTAHGLRTGLYTSPHFVTPRERIRIDGSMLAANQWPGLANRVMAAGGEALTYFEFLTVLCLLAFREADVQLAVLEAGLGGAHDATTAVAADVVCVTPIGLDHQAVLGPTIAAIAADKAGALRPGVPAVTAPQPADAMNELRAAADACGATLHEADDVARLPAKAELGLAGPHQRTNALVALAAWTTLATANDWESHEDAVHRGLAEAWIPGRLQWVERPAAEPYDADGADETDAPVAPKAPGMPDMPARLVIDGAHNAHGLVALRAALADQCARPAVVIFSCLADKDLAAVAEEVRRIAGDAPVLVPTIRNNARAARGEDLATLLGPAARAVPDMAAALAEATALAPQGPVLLCGSLYLLGEFFTLRPDCLESRGAGGTCEVPAEHSNRSPGTSPDTSPGAPPAASSATHPDDAPETPPGPPHSGN